VIATVCQHENRRTNGKTPTGAQRYRCKTCGKSWTESTDKLGGMRIGMDRAVTIVTLLCEGMSVSGAARATNTDPHTILDLLVYVGERCEAYMQEAIKDVYVDDVQVDEIWQFILCKRATAKQSNMVARRHGPILSWMLIARDQECDFRETPRVAFVGGYPIHNSVSKNARHK
jgi:transposase-like protein